MPCLDLKNSFNHLEHLIFPSKVNNWSVIYLNHKKVEEFIRQKHLYDCNNSIYQEIKTN